MLEVGKRLSLALESGDEDLIHGEFHREELDRYLALQRCLAALIHCAHPAEADEFLDPVLRKQLCQMLHIGWIPG